MQSLKLHKDRCPLSPVATDKRKGPKLHASTIADMLVHDQHASK